MLFSKKLEESPLDSLYTLIQEYLGILATRCASCNVWHALIKTMYCDNIMINVSCAAINCSIILSSVKLEKRFSIAKRVSSRLLTSPHSLLKNYWIHSFWSQNTEKRKTTISQMRLRSMFKMRISILNTATTEQMGYGSISFFVCSLMNQIVKMFHVKHNI